MRDSDLYDGSQAIHGGVTMDDVRETIEAEVGRGPAREDGLPAWVSWGGERFDTPELEELEAWTVDSVCESLLGDEVEHDGCDAEGSPSWLLALGLV
jgi:hypothetical protein